MKMTIPDKDLIFSNILVSEIHRKLQDIPRAGWVKRGIKNPENVGEHTKAIEQLMNKWKEELQIQDPDKLAIMIRIHDWPEILHGDELTYHLDGEEYKKAKGDKHQNEFRAMKQLCTSLGELGDTFINLWLSFEKQEDHDSKIGYQLDKLQAVIKALEYQQGGQPVQAMEFVNEVRKRNQIEHPFLVSVLNQVENESFH